jgi:hypothetical protein
MKTMLSHRPILAFVLLAAACQPSASDEAKTEKQDVAERVPLREIIEAHDVQSVEQLLPLLDDDLLSHPVLLHVSGSLHVATHTTPRIVLHTADGRMSLAFNSGASGKTGDQSLEVMEFDDEQAAFVFSEVKFPLDQVGAPSFSEPNPERCIGCHDLPARPNWASYPTWSGAYGEQGDVVIKGSAEADGLAEFLALQPTHPRYKYLKKVAERYATDANGKLAASPNSALLDVFARLNVKRIAAEVKASSAYANHRDDLIALLSGCTGAGDLVGEAKKLGLAIDLASWTLNFLGKDDESRQPLQVEPFRDAQGDYLSRGFLPALSELDPELKGRAAPCS